MTSSMEKEIMEQPKVLASIIKNYVKEGEVKVDFPNNLKKIKFVASGSSYNCSRLAEKFFKDMTDIDASCEFASEFLANKKVKIDKDTLYYFISQSGKTVDTLDVLEKVKKAGAKTFALVNVEDSPMFKEADYSMCAMAGEEKAIAATKSFTACILCAWLTAVKMSGNSKYYLENVNDIEEELTKVVSDTKQIEVCAEFLSTQKSFPIIGYNYYFALANEGALKTKETSYIDSNAYALGEFIHGHIALLNEKNAVLEIFSKEDLGDFEIKNLRKIKNNYNPKIVTISDYEGELKGDYNILLPNFKCEIVKLLAMTIVIQLLALNIATKLNRDIDNPNGLSKIVV